MGARLEAFFLREWQQGSAWQFLLRPISWCYRALIALRKFAFDHGYAHAERIDAPVVVVGNISVGGTGKTPVVLALSTWLAERGRHPGIVTRGYTRGNTEARSTPGSVIHVVAPSIGSTPVSSDEARLLAERSELPVFAGARRAQVAKALREKFPESDVIVCDDGLQHYALKRDVEIAVVDGTRGFGNGQCLPAGPLREPIERLREVDCIVVNNPHQGVQARSDRDNAAARAAAMREALNRSEVPVFEMAYTNARMIKLGQNKSSTAVDESSAASFAEAMSGKRIFAIAGIGHPERFFSQVRNIGITLSDVKAFPDHHDYRIQDLRALDADVILMTEKDAVKCREFAGVDDRMWMMRVDAALPDAFFEFVLKKIDHVARP